MPYVETTGGINTVNLAGAYPSAGGESIGMQAGAFTDYSASAPMMPDMAMPSNAVAQMQVQAMDNGNGNGKPHKSPASWWVGLIILLFALMWISERFGSEGAQFSNIKLTFYNAIVITLAVVLGMTLLKAGSSKYPNNPVSQLILAS